MTFGEKLYQLRKQHGLSQEALADKLNTSRQAVSKWENNNGYPETEKLILLAKLFQVNLDDLLLEERKIGKESGSAAANAQDWEGDKRGDKDGYYVSRETANGFLLYYKKKFLLVAAACGILLGCNANSYSSTEPGLFELIVEPAFTAVTVMILFAVVFYTILKQNPYRNLRKKKLIFAADVKKELQDEFSKLKRVLLAGIIICVVIVGMNEMYFSRWLALHWEDMFLLSEAECLQGMLGDMILMGVCGFVAAFCVGVYWSYTVLLHNDVEEI